MGSEPRSKGSLRGCWVGKANGAVSYETTVSLLRWYLPWQQQSWGILNISSCLAHGVFWGTGTFDSWPLFPRVAWVSNSTWGNDRALQGGCGHFMHMALCFYSLLSSTAMLFEFLCLLFIVVLPSSWLSFVIFFSPCSRSDSWTRPLCLKTGVGWENRFPDLQSSNHLKYCTHLQINGAISK